MSGSHLLVFARKRCSRCGARNETEAETICRPTRGIDDEWDCPVNDADTDAEGYFRAPTKASLAAMDAWIDEQMKDEQ